MLLSESEAAARDQSGTRSKSHLFESLTMDERFLTDFTQEIAPLGTSPPEIRTMHQITSQPLPPSPTKILIFFSDLPTQA
jgi:hypothetical protein